MTMLMLETALKYLLDGKSTLLQCVSQQHKYQISVTFSEMTCESVPKVTNAQFEGRQKRFYEPGETIRYQCDPGFQIVGSPEIICRKGNWTAPPFCEGIDSTSK